MRTMTFRIIGIVCVVCAFSACTQFGYRVGSMLPADVKTVYVPTVINKSGEPLNESEITAATINELQIDGSLRVSQTEDSDTKLYITLTGYHLEPLSYDRDQISIANEYRLTLYASIALVRTDNGEVLAERAAVTGDTTFSLIGGLSSSKLQALPEAAEDLAYGIVEAVVETWR